MVGPSQFQIVRLYPAYKLISLYAYKLTHLLSFASLLILDSKEGETEDETFKITTMKIHEDWDNNTDANDIAILKINGTTTRSRFRELTRARRSRSDVGH